MNHGLAFALAFLLASLMCSPRSDELAHRDACAVKPIKAFCR